MTPHCSYSTPKGYLYLKDKKCWWCLIKTRSSNKKEHLKNLKKKKRKKEKVESGLREEEYNEVILV